MKFTCRLLAAYIAVPMFCSFLIAQQSVPQPSAGVPRLVNFSGKAADAQGKTITGIAGATFAIYKDQSGGSPLWMETQNVQVDAKGSYLVQLGATKPDGLPRLPHPCRVLCDRVGILPSSSFVSEQQTFAP